MLSNEAKAYKASLVAVICNLFLLSLKGIVGFLIGSLSVLADALDSFTDLLAAVLMYFFLRQAMLPPDEDHPFGHGKYDAVASLSQATIIAGTGIVLIFEAVNKIIHKLPVRAPEFGIGVMLVNILSKVMLVRYYSKVSKETGSLSILSLQGNYTVDIFNSLGIIFALLIAKVWGIQIVDPLVAMLIALFFLRVAITIFREAFSQILDKAPQEAQAIIEKLLMEHYPQLVGFHKLRVRKTGGSLQMDMHILLPDDPSLEKAHDLSEHLESDIREIFPSSVVVIHMEPVRKDVQRGLESKKPE